MSKHHRPRNKTGKCDRELWAGPAKKQAFGIYRPLTEDSAAELTEALNGAQSKAEARLRRVRRSKPISEFAVREAFGVTFVPRSQIKNAMGYGLLQHIVSVARVIDDIESHNDGKDIELDVALDMNNGFDWPGDDRTLIVRLDKSCEGAKELVREAPHVESLLRLSDSGRLKSRLRIFKPDHVTLLDYGVEGDNRDLSLPQQYDVADIYRDQFLESKLTKLTLGGLMLADGFDSPRLQ